MVTQSAFFPLQVPTNMVGASFATIDVDEFDDFIISSCNQLFFDMVDCNSPPCCRQVNGVACWSAGRPLTYRPKPPEGWC